MTMPADMASLLTADDLLQVQLPGKWLELVEGRLVVREPPGGWHGKVAAQLTWLLGDFVYPHGRGMLFGQDTGFRIATDPDTVRAPDVAFVSRERAAAIERSGYPALAPDLVVEIVSPADRPGELLNRVGDWLNAGVGVVWVIDPTREVAQLHRADGSMELVPANGTLVGEGALEGFSCPLARVLE